MSIIKYQHTSNCNISENPCEVCRVLNREEYSVVEKSIDTVQTVITLKKVRTDVNGNVTDSYPITSVDEGFVKSYCVQAILKSCTALGEKSEEIVSVIDMDSSTGKITMNRTHPVIHTGDLSIDFDIISPEMINTYANVLCELYEAYCGVYPPNSSTTSAGIGLASAVSPENEGSAPTFITTDDSKWQALLASSGGDISDTALKDMLDYFNTTTSCSGSPKTNLKVLEDLLSVTCGKESCLNNLLTALCGVFDTIIENGNTTGVKISERFLSVDHGVKKIIAHSIERHGNFNLSATDNKVFEPTSDSDDNPLLTNFTGLGNQAGYIETMIYDQANVMLPRRGELIINGTLSAGWNKGATQGIIEIKQGTVIVATYISFIGDQRGQTRGSEFSPLSSPIADYNISLKTRALMAGEYSITFKTNFALAPEEETTESAAIYKYSHTAEFNPIY